VGNSTISLFGRAPASPETDSARTVGEKVALWPIDRAGWVCSTTCGRQSAEIREGYLPRRWAGRFAAVRSRASATPRRARAQVARAVRSEVTFPFTSVSPRPAKRSHNCFQRRRRPQRLVPTHRGARPSTRIGKTAPRYGRSLATRPAGPFDRSTWVETAVSFCKRR
jgi:hypothetical protein